MKTLGFILMLSLTLSACGREVIPANSPKSVTPVTSDAQCSGRATNQPFKSDDGCNTCTCDAKGRMMCTLMACAP